MNRLCEWILKIILSFSRNEPLHPVLDALAENDEEDELLSSKARTQRERECFPSSISIQFILSMGMILDEEPAGSLPCGFAFAF